MHSTLALILGGGQGSRLFPLTYSRSKPAVPIGGKYRLIDIPVSNCLNSNINRIFILTQFNSASLNKHINQTYRFDNFHKGFVDILAAEQSIDSTDWFQGTADAVRKNLKHIIAYYDLTHVMILSGDQIYKMDFNELVNFHRENNADITISVLPVEKKETPLLGIVKMKKDRIIDFVEKPKDEKILKELKTGKFIHEKFPDIGGDKEYLASMGIYYFNIDTLVELLNSNNFRDFGHEIIPLAIKTKNVAGYLFNGYWEDVGTIFAFWRANLDFASLKPKFDFYSNLIYTNARYLPASRVISCKINESLICEGSIINNSTITNSIIGIRTIIRDNVTIEKSMVMGADFFETEENKQLNRTSGMIDVGIGSNTIIKNAIIDKNARIGSNCRIINKDNLEKYDGENYYIREKIIIVPKNSIIKDNTVI
jgi:glucose-1-phosphate adenylyltransferase